MTVQTAIDLLENLDGMIEDNHNNDYDTAFKIAKECMEKQIPQSPTLEGDGYCPEGHLVYDTWFCPNCDKSYEVDYDDYDYCPNCGQKIDKSVFDWEEGGTSEV